MVEMVQRELRRGGDIIKYRYDGEPSIRELTSFPRLCCVLFRQSTVPEERDLGLDDMISSDKKHWKFGGCEAKKKKL